MNRRTRRALHLGHWMQFNHLQFDHETRYFLRYFRLDIDGVDAEHERGIL
jgi:hypothetical protein